MISWADALKDPVRRRALVVDGAKLVESEVASKRGLRAAALKTGFKGFKKIQPGVVESAVDRLLPHFAPVLDPFWADASQTSDPVAAMTARDSEIADALLGVTDRLSAKAKNRVMVRIYNGLRGQARGHVLAAVPGLSRVILKHAE